MYEVSIFGRSVKTPSVLYWPGSRMAMCVDSIYGRKKGCLRSTKFTTRLMSSCSCKYSVKSKEFWVKNYTLFKPAYMYFQTTFQKYILTTTLACRKESINFLCELFLNKNDKKGKLNKYFRTL